MNKNKIIKVGQVGFLRMYLSTLQLVKDTDYVVVEGDHLNVYSQDDIDKLNKMSNKKG